MAGKTYNPLTAQQQCNIICGKKTTQFEGQAPVRQFSMLRVDTWDTGEFVPSLRGFQILFHSFSVFIFQIFIGNVQWTGQANLELY